MILSKGGKDSAEGGGWKGTYLIRGFWLSRIELVGGCGVGGRGVVWCSKGKGGGREAFFPRSPEKGSGHEHI